MCANQDQPDTIQLTQEQARYFKNLIREARYAAQADAENFSKICFAIEDLGRFLERNPKNDNMGRYKNKISLIARHSSSFYQEKDSPDVFKKFDSIYELVRKGRNDNMHSGAYARNITQHAIELCIGLEDSLNSSENIKKQDNKPINMTAADHMSPNPVSAEPWHQIGHVRKLMLMNSYSFIPVYVKNSNDPKSETENEGWKIISDTQLAITLKDYQKQRLRMEIKDAIAEEILTPIDIEDHKLLEPQDPIDNAINQLKDNNEPNLILVVKNRKNEKDKLLGVISAFDLL